MDKRREKMELEGLKEKNKTQNNVDIVLKFDNSKEGVYDHEVCAGGNLLGNFDEFVQNTLEVCQESSSLKIENDRLLKEVTLLRNELQQTQSLLFNKVNEIQEMNLKECSVLLSNSNKLTNASDKINWIKEKGDLTKELSRISNLNQELREELHQERAERIRLSRP